MENKNDIQALNDTRNISIDQVGVKDIQYPIIVDDKIWGKQHTVGNFDLFVKLPAKHRGTHMSRFIEILNEFHKEIIIDNLPLLLKEIQQRMEVNSAYCKIKFPYFIEKESPASGLKSLMDYICYFEALLEDNKYELKIGVDVPVTTLCPCSKELSEKGAHNQRSIISVMISHTGFIWLEDLIEIVESCASCEIFPLLKRIDEKYVTDKAYAKPMFVEDVVRDLSLKLKNDNRIISYRIKSEHFESIHNHNAFAYLESKNGDFK